MMSTAFLSPVCGPCQKLSHHQKIAGFEKSLNELVKMSTLSTIPRRRAEMPGSDGVGNRLVMPHEGCFEIEVMKNESK
jgi:hypothetical protein